MRFTIKTKEDKDRIKKAIDNLAPGKIFLAEIKQHRKTRSLSQNALYHLWLSAISNQTGNSAPDLHEYFKERYIPRHSYSVFGYSIDRAKSTSEMTTVEFNTYLESVYNEVTSNGIADIYYPRDPHWENFYNYYSER